MSDPSLAMAIVGFMLTWTVSIISLVMWLTGKFRDLEKIIYREMDKHRTEDDRQFRAIGTRVQRLELRAFGFTGTPATEPGVIP